MKKQKELAKNTLIISIGKICTQFMSFFLLPLYTAVLTKEEYGLVDLFSTYTLLLMPVILMQIDQALFRFMIDKRSDKKGMTEIVSASVFFVIFECLVTSVLFAAVSPFLNFGYKWFLLAYLIAVAWSTMMLQLARGFGKNVHYSIAGFLSAAVQIVFNLILLLIFKLGVRGMLTANISGHLICALFIAISTGLFKYTRLSAFKLSQLRSLLKYSIPLIPNALCWWALNASDRLIVSSFLGMGFNGLCAIGHKFSFVVITFYNIFNISWTESASLHINDEDRAEFFKSTIDTALKLFCCFALIIIAFMPFAFNILVNKSFADAYNLIPVYMIASIFNVLVGLYSVVYVALKKTKEISRTSLMSGLINIAVHLLLIKVIGVYAAPLSSAVAFGVMGIYRYIDIQKYINVKLDMNFVWKFIILYIGICAAYYINNIYLNIGATIITVIFTVNCNWYMIKSIIADIKLNICKLR